MMDRDRVILIGLDGACFDMIGKWLDAGRLKALQKLTDSGVHTPMRSIIPPYTSGAWTTIMTGRDVDEHSVFDFIELQKNTYSPRFITSRDVRVPYIWEMIGQQARRSIVINVPLTHPPRKVEGVHIPGFMAPENPECYPPHILEELRSGMGGYSPYWANESVESTSFDEKLYGYLRLAEMRRDAARYLSQHYDWDLLIVVFHRIDSIFHVLNKEGISDGESRVLELYELVDRCIADIIEPYPDSTVFVVSDHGIGLTNWTFSINTWLRSKGYLQTKFDSNPDPFEIDEQLFQLHDVKREGESLSAIERVLAVLARVGLSKQRFDNILLKMGLDELIRKIIPYSLLKTQAGSQKIDWERSLAFCYQPSGYGIWLNVSEREPFGIVRPGVEYEELRDSLVNQLTCLRDPDGEPVFDLVARREELFKGDQIEHIPDIVLRPRACDYRLEKRLRGKAFIRNHHHYSHKMDGLFIARGTNIRSGSQGFASTPTILDFAPTLLYALGLPVDESMRGRVLLEVFDDRFVKECPVRYTTYENLHKVAAIDTTEGISDDEDTLKERLQALGYLD